MADSENGTSKYRPYGGVVDYVDDWFLMDKPWPMLGLWLAYVLFVLKIGPHLMAKRPAFQLKNTLLLYNIFQISLSAYIFYMGSSVLLSEGLVSSHCAVEAKETQAYIVRGIYIYFLAKVSEFADTVLFILRKKSNQVTFLHVYHHSLMMVATWFGLKYNPTDAYIFLGTLNSLVHVVMYGYYGLSAFPSLTKYLWWKKYITTMQLVQFGMIAVHVTVGAFISTCSMPYVLLITIYTNAAAMIYLFLDFYMKSYVNKNESPKDNNKAVSEKNKSEKGVVTSMIKKDSKSVQSTKLKGV